VTRRTLLLSAVSLPEGTDDWQFVQKYNRFAKAANDWMETYRNGLFDLRGAKRLSKLWRDIEASGMWPKP
jgi:hypothetical protein